MTTKLFLDVDGVINNLTYAYYGSEKVTEDSRLFVANGFRMAVAERLVTFFQDLEKRDDVELYWLTTWLHDAPKELSPHIEFGADWTVVEGNPWTSLGPWWKFVEIRSHVEEGDRVIWLDDDLALERRLWPSLQSWIHGLEDNILALSPDSEVGLTEAHTSRILHFLEEA